MRRRWSASAVMVADRPRQLDAEGFIGQLFKTIGKYVPPAPGARSPRPCGHAHALAECSNRTARPSLRRSGTSLCVTAHRAIGWIFRTYYVTGAESIRHLGRRTHAALQADLLSWLIGSTGQATAP